MATMEQDFTFAGSHAGPHIIQFQRCELSGLWFMIAFAVLEFLAGVVSIVEASVALSIAGKHGISDSVTYSLVSLQTQITWGLVMSVISLLSLFGVTAYYTLGHKVQHYHKLTHSTVYGFAFVFKVVVIVVGAVGVVASTTGASVLFSAIAYNKLVPYSTLKAREDSSASLTSAAALQLTCLLLKLLEAVLGHVFALMLTNCHVRARTR